MQARLSLGVGIVRPIQNLCTFLRASRKTVQNMYQPAQSDKIFQSGHPYWLGHTRTLEAMSVTFERLRKQKCCTSEIVHY